MPPTTNIIVAIISGTTLIHTLAASEVVKSEDEPSTFQQQRSNRVDETESDQGQSGDDAIQRLGGVSAGIKHGSRKVLTFVPAA